jgi:hypothetical protein
MLRDCVERDGFAIEAKVVNHREAKWLLEALQVARLPRSRAGIRHAMRHKEVAKIAGIGPLIEIAKQILGPDAVPFRATLFDKSPVSNWLVAWHQDTSLPLVERRETAGWGP